MSSSEGGISNVSKEELVEKFIKVSLVYDLVFFLFLSLFVFCYIKMTPFSGVGYGFLSFVAMVAGSLLSFVALDVLGRERDWPIVSTYEHFSELEIFSGMSKVNTSFILISFAFVWLWALIYAPHNTYDTEFRPNVISWLDKGKCNEIKKWEEDTAIFCSQMVEARKNLKGVFTVATKNLNPAATGCTYGLSSEGGMYVVTDRLQSCGLSVDQKVFVGLYPFSDIDSHGRHSGYAYSLQVLLMR